MRISDWLNGRRSSRFSRRTRARSQRPSRSTHFRQPQPHIAQVCESLEDRTLLSVFTVINTDDSGEGSLRQAILDANTNPNSGGPDEIHFEIPGSGVHTIQPATGLPDITDPVILDGYTQPGASPNTNATLLGSNGAGSNAVLRIEINGSETSAAGLSLNAGNSTVRGLVLNGFRGTGAAAIRLAAADGNVVEGNFIGTDDGGTVAQRNTYGVLITSGSGNNLIGGTTAASRNVISGNSSGVRMDGDQGVTGNQLQGNLIGTSASGTMTVPNSFSVEIRNVPGNTVGGVDANAGNLISGNTFGVFVHNSGATGTTIQGNYIGTDVTGMIDLGNVNAGVLINSASQTLVGGTESGAGNLISGNGGGVRIVEAISNAVPQDNRLEGNWIGTDATGTGALGNSGTGIEITGGLDHVVGGTAAAAANVIAANTRHGISVADAPGTEILGNLIGVDTSGAAALANGDVGIHIASTDVTIGGTTPNAGNVISGNLGFGVEIRDDDNTVQGNWIGTDRTGTAELGNADGGFFIWASNNLIGGTSNAAGNVIAFNSGDGVFVNTGGAGNAIVGNAIFENTELGIDLAGDGVTLNDDNDTDSGANDIQNFPVLTAADSSSNGTRIQGALNSTAQTLFHLEFFASETGDPSGHGEGQQFLGSGFATTDASGDATFDVLVPGTAADGWAVTATATRIDQGENLRSTSEFSASVQASASQPASISGQVFDDRNGNGLRDAGEPGLNGWTVSLGTDDSSVPLATTTTDSVDRNGDGQIDPVTERGYYSFLDVDPGTYEISQTLMTGWEQTVPAEQNSQTVSIAASQTISDIDFGNREVVSSGPLQIVSTQTLRTIPEGATFLVPVEYSTSDGDETLSGLGVRLHFDSSVLTYRELEDHLNNGFLTSQVLDDQQDLDGDASTDRFLLLAWDSVQATWPSRSLPTDLFSAKFTVAADATPGSETTLRFSAASTAVTHGFQGDPVTVQIQRASLDVDADGRADALSDGLLIQRYLNDTRGEELVSGVLGAGATRTDPDEIAAYLDFLRTTMLDPDANGRSLPFPDGDIIQRYLFGFRGCDLVHEDLLSSDDIRNDLPNIAARLDSFHPNPPPAPTTADVHGRVFVDSNGNGVYDFDPEYVLPGVTVYADLDADNVLDEDEPRAMTAENGNYKLDVPPGEHIIRLVGRTSTGSLVVTSPSEGTHSITVDVGGQCFIRRNFGTIPVNSDVVIWTGPDVGDWQDATNWNTGSVPEPDETVIISRADADVVVTYTGGDAEVQSIISHERLRVTGGTLTTNNFNKLTDVEVQQGASLKFKSTDKSMPDPVFVLNLSGTFENSGSVELGGGLELNNGALMINRGTISVPEDTTSDAAQPTRSIVIRENSRFENHADANLQVDAPVSLNISGGTLSNFGRTEYTKVESIILKAGAALINHGSLTISGHVGVDSSNDKHKGPICIDGGSHFENKSGATVRFEAPTNITVTAGTLTNAGQMTFAHGGSLTLSDSSVFENLAGAIHQIDVCCDFTMDILGGSQVQNAGTLQLTPRTLVNIGANSVLQNDSGGTLQSVPAPDDLGPEHAFTLVNSGGLLENQGVLDFDSTANLDVTAGTLTNAGQMTFAHGGSLTLSDSSVFENLAGAIHQIDICCEFTMDILGGSQVLNAGTLQLTPRTLVNIGANSVLRNDSGGTLQSVPAPDDLGPEHAFTLVNSGGLLENQGVLDFDSTANLDVTAGTLTNAGQMTFAHGGSLTLSDSSVFENLAGAVNHILICCDFTMDILGGSQVLNAGTLQLTPRTLVNIGANSVLRNDSGGTLRWSPVPAELGPEHAFRVVTDGGVLENRGTFAVASGTLVVGDGSNTGTVDLGSEATLVLVGSFDFNAGSVLIGDGLLRIDPEVLGPVVRINTDLSVSSLEMGTLADVRTSGSLSTGSDLVLDGRTLGGTGTLSTNVINNSSLISPGFSPGTLTINGNYNQSAGGGLTIEIGGLAAGTEFDQLIITGTATLDGPLSVVLLNDFVPSEGDEFLVLTYSDRMGEFDALTGLDVPGDLVLVPEYGESGLSLVTVPEFPADVQQAAYELDQKLGLKFKGRYFQDWGGRDERWLRAKDRQWYFITPDGRLYAWDGSRRASGELIATFDASVHTHPERLFAAQPLPADPAPNPEHVQQLAYELDQQHGFKFTGSLSEDWGGRGEKWIRANDGRWHFLVPDGRLLAWDGQRSAATGTLVATLSEAVYVDPSLLYDAQPLPPASPPDPTVIQQRALELDQMLGLELFVDLFEDWIGRGEKWVRAASGDWLFIVPNGTLYAWDGSRNATGDAVAELSVHVYDNPALLYDAANSLLEMPAAEIDGVFEDANGLGEALS